MKLNFILLGFFLFAIQAYGQNSGLVRLDFLPGDWQGTGTGFGNATSVIEAQFKLVMDGKYIEVMHHSQFAPTNKNPEGDQHTDKGFISFDKSRNVIVYRQFNSEGYVNQYVMNDSLCTDSVFVFETEIIENFVPGGNARWTIKRLADDQIETIFDVSFPGKEYACFGTNRLNRINQEQ